jgi:hypothetical protein
MLVERITENGVANYVTRLTSRVAVMTAVIALVAAQGAAARAATVPVYFSSTEQTFNGTVDLTGNLDATGSGEAFNPLTKASEPFTITAPTSHPLGIDGGPITVTTNPASAGYASFGVDGGHLTSVAGLNLNLLNGTTSDFSLLPIDVTTSSKISILKNVEIGLTGTLASLVFQQTGDATFSPTGAGTGSFEIFGNAASALLNVNATALGIVNIPVDAQYLSTPLTLSGTYKITGDDANPKIELDGAVGLGLPLDIASALTAALDAPLALSIDAALDLAATVSVNLGFHLEQSAIYIPPSDPGTGQTGGPPTVPADFKFGSIVTFDSAGQPLFQPLVPEPGSAVLLLLGLVAAMPVAVRRLRKVRRASAE